MNDALKEWLGEAWHGKAGRGKAGRGKAGQGKARQGVWRNYKPPLKIIMEQTINNDTIKLIFSLAFGFLFFISGVIVLIKLMTMIF